MRHLNRVIALLVISLGVWMAPGVARAQSQGPDQPPSRPPRSPRQPAPPLFPKHRRGIYKNNQGIEVVDATPQSPPLETDDPGVPDNGEYEINLLTRLDLSKETQS